MSHVDEKGIWDLYIAKKRHKLDLYLAAAITDWYFPTAVADIGCGIGKYCVVFKAFGWSLVHGYEGTKNIGAIAVYDKIFEVDLSAPVEFTFNYDLVLFLEVGEHVPEQYEQVLIDNVCRASTDIIIASWATPGQYSASGHVNCKPRKYIIEQFEKRGFECNRVQSAGLREKAGLPWFKKNLMEFRRK